MPRLATASRPRKPAIWFGLSWLFGPLVAMSLSPRAHGLPSLALQAPASRGTHAERFTDALEDAIANLRICCYFDSAHRPRMGPLRRPEKQSKRVDRAIFRSANSARENGFFPRVGGPRCGTVAVSPQLVYCRES